MSTHKPAVHLPSVSSKLPPVTPLPFHRVTLALRGLFRLLSTADDDSIAGVDEFTEKWSKFQQETAGGIRKKSDEAPSLKQEQFYHLEYALPLADPINGVATVEPVKFFVDIVGLQFMAKLYYGRVDTQQKLGVVDDVKTTSTRYVRRNGHTFLFFELSEELLLTEDSVRAGATYRVEVTVYESYDKLCARAKADIKGLKKLTIPEFPALKVKQRTGKEEAMGGEDVGDAVTLAAVGDLVRDYDNGLPGWMLPSVAPVFPLTTIHAEAPPQVFESPQETTKTSKQQGRKRMAAKKNRAEDEVARRARRKTEAYKVPVITFRACASKFFADNHGFVARADINPKAGRESDVEIDLVCTLFDGLLWMGIADGNLLSTEYRTNLNPISICVKMIERLPVKPHSHEELRQVCSPAYFSLYPFDAQLYKSSALPHERNLMWDEPVITMVADLDAELLKEALAGPPMPIYLHDRERKGGDADSAPTAVAHLDLYPLLAYNLFQMEQEVPVLPLVKGEEFKQEFRSMKKAAKDVPADLSARGDVRKSAKERQFSQRRSTVRKPIVRERRVADEKPKLPPLAIGRYEDAGTTMTVKISVAYPLKDYIRKSERTGSTPFCRYTIILPRQRDSSRRVIQSFCNFISCYNGKVSGFGSEARTKWAVLSDLTLFSGDAVVGGATSVQTNKEGAVTELTDVLNCFHICDPNVHLVLVEGRFDDGVVRLADFVESQITECSDSATWRTLWDSSLRFSKRIYWSLGLSPLGIELHGSLMDIAAMDELKLRKLFSYEVVIALLQLSHIAYDVRIPRDVFKRSLFPDPKALLKLRHELGDLYCSK